MRLVTHSSLMQYWTRSQKLRPSMLHLATILYAAMCMLIYSMCMFTHTQTAGVAHLAYYQTSVTAGCILVHVRTFIWFILAKGYDRVQGGVCRSFIGNCYDQDYMLASTLRFTAFRYTCTCMYMYMHNVNPVDITLYTLWKTAERSRNHVLKNSA